MYNGYVKCLSDIQLDIIPSNSSISKTTFVSQSHANEHKLSSICRTLWVKFYGIWQSNETHT